jgi:hypothetical protein
MLQSKGRDGKKTTSIFERKKGGPKKLVFPQKMGSDQKGYLVLAR